MDHQTFFSTGFLGLKAQGFRRSVRDHNICLYRGPMGRKCFVGHNISDEEYKPVMDSACYTLPNFLGRGMFTEITAEQFNRLQAIHDTSSSPEMMEDRLREYAKNHDLTIPGE